MFSGLRLKAGWLVPLAIFVLVGDSMGRSAMTIVDFSQSDGPSWQVVDDVVMGGVSRSSLKQTDAGTAIFAGELSLERNGGFASVRAALEPTDLSAYSGIEIRVRGDGKRYRLRLRTDERFDGIAYQAALATGDDAWQVVRLPFTEFLPTFRGRILTDVDALATDRIRQIGLMIADKQVGPFQLEVAWIRAYAEEPTTAHD